MKKPNLPILIIIIFMLAASIALAQKKNPKLNPNLPKGDVKIVKPDLMISDLKMDADAATGFIKTITVTVKNACQAKSAAAYLLITIKVSADKNALTLLYVGNSIKPLKGGESQTQTFNIAPLKNIPANSFILVEADSKNQTDEGDENNNWRRLNPNSSPFPKADTCEPK